MNDLQSAGVAGEFLFTLEEVAVDRSEDLAEPGSEIVDLLGRGY